MGRLIDADRLIKKILQEAAHQACINHPENARGLKYAAELINQQPTAYSVDGVVEQLEKLERYFIYSIRDLVELPEVIDILKGAVKE